MNSSRSVVGRRTWNIIFGAMTFSVFVYALLCYVIEHSNNLRHADPSLPTVRPILILLAVVDLMAAVACLRIRVDGKIGEEGRDLVLSPGEFQTYSIMALAFSEGCTILGLILFFIGAPLVEFVLFGIGTLFVNFAFIRSRGLQFWNAYERSHRT